MTTTAHPVHIPATARLIDPPTADEREKWNDMRGWSLSETPLHVYVMRLRMSHGLTLDQVAR